MWACKPGVELQGLLLAVGGRMRQRKVGHCALLLDWDPVAGRHASQTMILHRTSMRSVDWQSYLDACKTEEPRLTSRPGEDCHHEQATHPAGRLLDVADRGLDPRPQFLERALAHCGADHFSDALRAQCICISIHIRLRGPYHNTRAFASASVADVPESRLRTPL